MSNQINYKEYLSQIQQHNPDGSLRENIFYLMLDMHLNTGSYLPYGHPDYYKEQYELFKEAEQLDIQAYIEKEDERKIQFPG